MHHAAIGGSLSLVEWLVLNTSFDISAHDEKGGTPLLFALMQQHLEVAGFLVKCGAVIDERAAGLVPLLGAAASQFFDTTPVLVNGGFRQQLLHGCARADNIAFFAHLLALGSSPSTADGPRKHSSSCCCGQWFVENCSVAAAPHPSSERDQQCRRHSTPSCSARKTFELRQTPRHVRRGS